MYNSESQSGGGRVTRLGDFPYFGRFFILWAIFHSLGDFSFFGRFFILWAFFLRQFFYEKYTRGHYI
jgi:hypothetical protein